ncbi:MAG TPA: uroporphyrinogen decarboxylase [bacterium]
MSVAVGSGRFLRACRRQGVDRTPVWFMRQAGRSQPEYRALRERYTLLEICAHPELVAEVTLRPVEQLGVDAAVLFADIMLPLEGIGVGFDLEEGRGPRIHAPLREAADLSALHTFAPTPTITAVLDGIRIIRQSSAVPLIGFAGAPFTLASYLVEGGPSREFLQTKSLMHRRTDVWSALLSRLTEMTVDYLRLQIRAGVQAVQLFDSWVGCLSPADYAAGVAPFTGAVCAAVTAMDVPLIHFGTNTAGLLPLMAAAGGDVIGVDWRTGLDDAWSRIGPERGIQGNLDPAVLLAEPAVIAAHAADVLARARGRPGHIFNLGHGVLPDTPQDHLRHLVDVVHAHEVHT